jgi:magnesium transporter
VRSRHITATGVHEIPAAGGPEVLRTEDGLVWIDLDHSDERAMALLPQLFDVRTSDVEDCHTRTPVAKLHAYADHHYSAINGLSRGSNGRLYFQPLKVFQNPHLVVTVLGPTSSDLPPDAARRELDAVHRRLDGDGFRPTTALDLISAIRREMMGTLEQLIGTAAGRIATFEKQMVEVDAVRSEKLLQQLFELRHDLQTIRTSAAQAHQTYTSLLETLSLQEGLLKVDVRRVSELRQGFGHIMNTTDLEREYLQEMLDLFQTRVSTELNQFVRKVTAWGSVGLARTVIAGLYGMNFTHMPELSWTWGYPAVLGLMVLVGTVLVIFFRRHGWL